MTTKTLTRELKSKLNALAILSNEKRFNILLALFTSSILKLGKHSHTFTDLCDIVDLSNSDLSYHLNLLKDAGLIVKTDYDEDDSKVTYYSISEEGKKLLNSVGLTPQQIKKTRSKISS